MIPLVQTYRQKLNDLLVKHQLADEAVKREKANLTAAEENVAEAEEAQKHIQAIAEQVQRRVHDQIATVVTRCLTAMLQEPYDFEIQFEQKRGRTEASLILKRGDLLLDDPLHQAGGGVLDVAAFATRIANLLLSNPPLRRVLLLDEPMRNLAPASIYGPRFRNLVQTLAEDLGIQFIIVTHKEEYQCGTVVQL